MTLTAFLALCFLTLSSASCLNGSVEFHGYCYYLQQEPTAYFYAETACNKLNGNLASIHNGFTNTFLKENVNATWHPDFWIGLNSLTNPKTWSWTDNTTLDFNEMATFASNLSFSCTSMIIKTGLWNSTVNCRESKPYVCAVPINATYFYRKCPIRFHYYEPTNACYGGYNIDSDFVFTFDAAEWECESQRAMLSSLHDENEIKFAAAVEHGWIGLHSNDNQKTWRWVDGSPVDYLPWLPGHPWKPILTCAYLNVNSEKPGLEDSICSNVIPFLCKKSL